MNNKREDDISYEKASNSSSRYDGFNASATSPFSTVLAETVNNTAASKEKQTLHIDQVIAEINQKKPISIK
ncbi:hypothetical protein ACLMAB_14915 [Brevibacillus laterosporus]